MNRSITTSLVLTTLLAAPAHAELKVGALAPPFTAEAAQGGKDLKVVLSDWLAQGPVVVYFYPKSFTSTCTEEAHLFAEATDEFKSLGARVIGISSDTIEIQREFSKMECRDKFPVAADPAGAIVRAYDAASGRSRGDAVTASRISYVIARNGKIASALTAYDAASHIENALKTVKTLRGE
ncbi:MAG: peroxiredoxin [Proteobacteria bacterium]|nr:peroxiredoxin [Pseudomonadota bacterium]